MAARGGRGSRQGKEVAAMEEGGIVIGRFEKGVRNTGGRGCATMGGRVYLLTVEVVFHGIRVTAAVIEHASIAGNEADALACWQL